MLSNKYEFDHAPSAILDYGFDWTLWLDTGETIVTSTWTATSGITLSSPQIADGITSTYASGGVSGTTYRLVNTIVTSATPARTDSRTILLSCKNR